MKGWRWMAGAALAMGIAACAPAREPRVPVSISPADLSRLGGEWTGEYSSPATGRSGSIVFHLTATADSAHGDVVMVPRGTGAPLRRAVYTGQPGTQPVQPQELTIRFARFQGERVTGMRDPYTDPDCHCPVSTTFEGTVAGNRIEGTFTTRGSPSGDPVTGTWRVERRQ
ncbi:hypothetical protein [Longimicrobium sp.]|uniref:hypothetical protein n=1 Tax=Longimicrobium sp. TaxID=2029185 RepID=UPI002BE17AF0|nr:hypothetical protein [Longimicrobium sp.]HSU17305.1 hypothetical protein [Longimicrobium sp.]